MELSNAERHNLMSLTNDIVTYRKQDYEWQVLVANREKVAKKYPKAMVIPATIDEIMLELAV